MHLVPIVFFNFAVIFPQDVQRKQGFDAYFQLKSLTGLAEETRLLPKYHIKNCCTKITIYFLLLSECTNIESTI